MSPRRRHSKRVNTTLLGEFAHGVCTQRAAAGKMVEVSTVGEHNSPSPRTLEPRDQFKDHELTGNICWDITVPSPVRDCPQNNESYLGWYYLRDVYQSIRTSYLISMLLF